MSLRERIRGMILAGDLPATKFARTWYGRGEGARCSACGLPVTTNEIEVEGDLEHIRGAYRFHNDCFDLWRAEIDQNSAVVPSLCKTR